MIEIEGYCGIEQLKIRNQFESVYIGNRRVDNLRVIIKEFNFVNRSSEIAFRRDVLVNFEHSNLSQYLNSFELLGKGYIVRKYIEGKSLDQAIKGIKRKKKAEFIIKSAIGILNGLEILHNNNILHRDLRPANIIYEEADNVLKADNFVLTDFSMVYSPLLNEIDTYEPFALVFSPPEQVLRCKAILNPSSDIYSLGLSMWTMFTGRFPFWHQIPEVAANLQITYPLNYDRKIPKEVFEIIKKASSKYIFAKSYRNYSRSELLEMLKIGQSSRYQTCREMREDLEKIVK